MFASLRFRQFDCLCLTSSFERPLPSGSRRQRWPNPKTRVAPSPATLQSSAWRTHCVACAVMSRRIHHRATGRSVPPRNPDVADAPRRHDERRLTTRAADQTAGDRARTARSPRLKPTAGHAFGCVKSELHGSWRRMREILPRHWSADACPQQIHFPSPARSPRRLGNVSLPFSAHHAIHRYSVDRLSRSLLTLLATPDVKHLVLAVDSRCAMRLALQKTGSPRAE